MAYGNIVGYEPGPQPGAYAFQRADGGKFLAFGAPAEDLKSRIDASRQQLGAVASNPDVTPQAVAQNDATDADDNARYLAASGASPETSDAARYAASLGAPPPAAGPVSSEQDAGVSEPNMSSAPEANASEAGATAAQAPAAQAQQPARGGEGQALFRDPKTKEIVYLVPGGDPKNPADLYTKTPGTAATPGGYAPSSMKVTGANAAINPGDVAALRENSIDQKLAYQQSYDLHAESAAEQRAALDAQADANAIAAKEAMARQQQMQAKADDMQAKYDQAKAEYAGSGIDAGRYMRGNWMSALGMALGALGAGIAKTPNFAQQFVEQQIQNDIRSQEAAIKIKGDRQQTALGDLQRQLGSLDLAKTAYQGVMLSESKRRLEVLANHQQSREMAAQYLQGAAQLDAALQANDVAFRKQAAGNVETEYRYHQASGGSAGGRNPITMEQARTAYDIAPKNKAGAKAEEKTAVVQDAITAADEAGAAAGLKWDPKKGEYTEGPAGSNALVGGAGLATEARQQAHGIISANAGKFAHALGERPPSVDMVDRYAGEFFTNGPQGVLHYKSRLSALRRNLDRSAKHASSLPDTPAERAEERESE